MIPIQLKDQLFCRVRKGEKRPFEENWNKKGYTYEEISQYFPKENYGVLTGINGLGVCDDDTPDLKLITILEKMCGESFRVRKHYYIKFSNWDGNKIIFYDKEGRHLGELQGLGQQVVGAGSLHPSGEYYEVIKDIPIIELDVVQFKELLKDYIPSKKVVQIPPKESFKTKWEGEDIKDIPVTSIISLGGMLDKGDGQYQGSHPLHGSTTGMNFSVNTISNTWYCYRCEKGGSSPELIAVMEGIIQCNEAGRGCLNGSKGSEVIKIAREKYGLKVPEVEIENIKREPMGWACSVNIKKMAERNNLLNCPKCNVPFEFNERIGFYKCPECKRFGGLKKFSNLILNHCKNKDDTTT